MIDLYKSSSVKDDKIRLLFELNQDNKVAINTPVGQTERKTIPNIIMQGTTPAPLLCSNSCDSLGRESEKDDEYLCLYKKKVKIPLLGCVDDLLGAASCGKPSLDLNIFINSKIEAKKLNFHLPDKKGKSKCKYLHVGPVRKSCPPLQVHGVNLKKVDDAVYLGDVIQSNGSNRKNIEERVSRGIGIVSQIVSLLETISLCYHFFPIALLLRESMLINSMLNSAEVWYDIKTKEVRELEAVDKILLLDLTKT